MSSLPRILLTGPPQCGKTTVVQRVVQGFPGRVAGFFTREVRQRGVRVGFEIVTLEGEVAWLSRVDFPGTQRVGKYVELHSALPVTIIGKYGKRNLDRSASVGPGPDAGGSGPFSHGIQRTGCNL